MGELILQNSARLLAMLGLLVLSGFFSGSETAFFSLSRDRLRRFRSGSSRVEHLAARLLDHPRSLLFTILFGNMVVNVTFFALSSRLLVGIGRVAGPAWSAAAGLVTLMVVIVLGEVAPKTMAATAPAGLARLASLPVYLLNRGLAPLRFVLNRGLVEPLTRLVTGRSTQPDPSDLFVTTDELQAIVELASGEGAVGRDEGEMINEVLELHETRVREVMVPRVDMVAADVATPVDEVRALFRRTQVKNLVVYRGNPDEVLGRLSARRVFLDGDPTDIESLVEPVHYVPEQQTVERLLKVFRDRGIQLAVVVDEYGGTAGLVTLEDCMEEIVGDIHEETERPREPVRRISDREFLLSGDLGMRAWNDYLRTEINTEMDVATLGGFVTGLLGRIPQAGDTVRYANLRFTVTEVRRGGRHGHGRPSWIRIEILRPDAEGDAAGGSAESTPAGGDGRRNGGRRRNGSARRNGAGGKGDADAS